MFLFGAFIVTPSCKEGFYNIFFLEFSNCFIWVYVIDCITVYKGENRKQNSFLVWNSSFWGVYTPKTPNEFWKIYKFK